MSCILISSALIHVSRKKLHPFLLVAHQELALTRRTPALPSPFQGGMGADWSASGEILCRLLAIYLTQQAAQYVFHVVPFVPHSVQKPFVFMRQSLSCMSAHV